MAKRPHDSSPKRNGIQALDSGTESIRFTDRDVLQMIEEARADNDAAEHGIRELYFVAMVNHATRLYRVKINLEMSPGAYLAFARQIGVSRTDANELWRLHPHRDMALAWAKLKTDTARNKGATVPVLSWRAFMRTLPRDDTATVVSPRPSPHALLKDALEIAKQTVRDERIKAEASHAVAGRLAEALENLRAENDALRAEVERLEAGEADDPVPDAAPIPDTPDGLKQWFRERGVPDAALTDKGAFSVAKQRPGFCDLRLDPQDTLDAAIVAMQRLLLPDPTDTKAGET